MLREPMCPTALGFQDPVHGVRRGRDDASNLVSWPRSAEDGFDIERDSHAGGAIWARGDELRILIAAFVGLDIRLFG
jgi:hypothetical protein